MSYLDKVTVGGTTYDLQDTPLGSLMSMTTDGFEQVFIDDTVTGAVSTNGDTIPVNPVSYTASPSVKGAVIACSPGDRFTYMGRNPGNGAHGFVFVTSGGVRPSGWTDPTNVNEPTVYTAPAGTAYLVINHNINPAYTGGENMYYKGAALYLQIKELKNAIVALGGTV